MLNFGRRFYARTMLVGGIIAVWLYWKRQTLVDNYCENGKERMERD